MAKAFQKDPIPLAAASPEHRHDNILIPALPSSSVPTSRPLALSSLSSLYNAGVAHCRDNKMPPQSLIKTPSVVKSNKANELSCGNLWVQHWKRMKSSGAGTGNNVATAHATSGGSRPPQPSRASRSDCGDGSGGTKMPPDVIEIESDDESSNKQQTSGPGCPPAPSSIPHSSTNRAPLADMSLAASQSGQTLENAIEIESDDESSNKQQTSGPRCPPARSSISHTAPSTNRAPLADMALPACQPGQTSAPDVTTRNNTAPATATASFVKHKAARPVHGCQRDPRPSVKPRGTTSNNDNSKCLPNYERRFHHDPRRAASSQGETPQKSDGRYRSASHGAGDQTSGSARGHPPVLDKTGVPTETDPVKLPQVQEGRASLSVSPDRQSIGEPRSEDAELRSQDRSSLSAASKREGETQHSPGSSALSQPLDHHGDRNRTKDPKQGEARMPGDRGEQGVGSSVAAPPVLEGRTSIPQPSAPRSNNGGVLADVGPPVRPSTSQDPVGIQQSLGRRPRSGTGVGENHRPVEDGFRKHDRGEVTGPPPKRQRISTSPPAVGKTVPKRQADPLRASSRSRPAQRLTTHHATPHRRCGTPKPRSSGVASTTEQSQEKFRSIERIVDFQARYLVKWEGYEPKHNSWEPDKHFHRCPELLDQFYQTGSATTNPPSLSQPKPRSAGGVSTTREAQELYFNVEGILDCEAWYLVKYTGYKRSRWVPAKQLDQCRKLLLQFHGRMGSVNELITRRIAAQMEARHSAA